MIRVKEKTEGRLEIVSPDRVHTLQTILFIVIGTIVTLAILADDEASIFIAIFPLLILVLGIVFAVRGGKTDSLVVDKNAGTVEIVLNVMGEKRKEPQVIAIDNIESSGLNAGTYGGVGEGRSHSVTGIDLILKDGTSVQATPKINQKRKMHRLYDEFREFSGL